MVIIGSGDHGDGLSSVQCWAITWTNDVLLTVGPSGSNLSAIKINQNPKLFIREDELANVVFKDGNHFILALMCQ